VIFWHFNTVKGDRSMPYNHGLTSMILWVSPSRSCLLAIFLPEKQNYDPEVRVLSIALPSYYPLDLLRNLLLFPEKRHFCVWCAKTYQTEIDYCSADKPYDNRGKGGSKARKALRVMKSVLSIKKRFPG
jgi:hypothetical protein